MILPDGGLRKFGETRHGEAAVPVEVGPERDHPDQPGRAGEMGVYPSDGGTEPGISWQHRPKRSFRPCESDITDLLETGRRDRTLGMSCTAVMVQVAATGKVEATATEKADVGESTNEVDGDSAAAAGGDGSSAKATEGSALVRGCYRCGKKAI